MLLAINEPKTKQKTFSYKKVDKTLYLCLHSFGAIVFSVVETYDGYLTVLKMPDL